LTWSSPDPVSPRVLKAKGMSDPGELSLPK